MQRKIVMICLLVGMTAVFGNLIYRKVNIQNSPDKILSKIETALDDEYKKHSMTEVVATIIYKNKDDSNKIYYRILKTTYYQGDPVAVTGLHTKAFNVLFPVDYMDSCKEMKIQNWDAALYKKGESAYLCWTYSPEVSYVLEYNPELIEDSEIIKMAESAELIE